MISWYNAILVQCYPGTMLSWYNAILIQWYPDTIYAIKPCFPDTMLSWYNTILVQWYPDTMISWYNNILIQWYPDTMLIQWYPDTMLSWQNMKWETGSKRLVTVFVVLCFRMATQMVTLVRGISGDINYCCHTDRGLCGWGNVAIIWRLYYIMLFKRV